MFTFISHLAAYLPIYRGLYSNLCYNIMCNVNDNQTVVMMHQEVPWLDQENFDRKLYGCQSPLIL